LPAATRAMNGRNLNFIIPATSVSGSPTTGSQENSKDQKPKRWNTHRACANRSALTGNQRFPAKRSSCVPSHQLTAAPAVLARVATAKSECQCPGHLATAAANPTSEVPGSSVDDRKADAASARWASSSGKLLIASGQSAGSARSRGDRAGGGQTSRCAQRAQDRPPQTFQQQARQWSVALLLRPPSGRAFRSHSVQ
jgi:hypothetical protein